MPAICRNKFGVIIAGIVCGLLSMTVFEKWYTKVNHVPLNRTETFIPLNPHSHGETDMFDGPINQQRWQDFHESNHLRKYCW